MVRNQDGQIRSDLMVRKQGWQIRSGVNGKKTKVGKLDQMLLVRKPRWAN